MNPEQQDRKTFEEPLEVQLILLKDMSPEKKDRKDRVVELFLQLSEYLDEIGTSFDELCLEVSCCGFSRRDVKLGDLELQQARISFSFTYQAEEPMPKLLRFNIIPKFYRDHIHGFLSTDYSAVLGNLYTMGYSEALARQFQYESDAVMDLLERRGYNIIKSPESD